MSVDIFPITIIANPSAGPRSFADSFTRANNNFWGINWLPGPLTHSTATAFLQPSILNGRGRIQQTVAAGTVLLQMVPAGLAYCALSSKNQFVQVTENAVTGNLAQTDYCVLSSMDEFDNTAGGYAIEVPSDATLNVRVLKFVWTANFADPNSPTRTVLASVGTVNSFGGFPITVRLEARVQPSTVELKGFVNGVLQTTQNDNTFRTGYPSLFYGSAALGNDVQIDDFSCGLL